MRSERSQDRKIIWCLYITNGIPIPMIGLNVKTILWVLQTIEDLIITILYNSLAIQEIVLSDNDKSLKRWPINDECH